METHLDMRLPSHIPHGIKYGYKYKTSIISTKSGNEYRNKNSLNSPVKTYTLFDNLYNFQEVAKLKTFFQLTKGRLYSFRFYDIFDNKIENHSIGVGDGVQKEFLLKSTESRKIYCPHKQSLKIKLSGKYNSKYQFNNGVIIFEKAPREGKVVTASCTYDIAVRFDEDDLSIICEQQDLFRIDEIKLVSIY